MKKRMFFLAIPLALVLLLIGIQIQNNIISKDQDRNQLNAPALHAELNIEAKEENVFAEPNQSYESQAEALLSKAFSYDATKNVPTIDGEGDLTTLRYHISDTDFFDVHFQDDFLYPSTLYHFFHLGEEPEFDLAKESTDYFKDEMVSSAKDFVQDVYGVDCSNADVHAYGYKNKISVQLEISEDVIFHVRFYYDESEPIGILFSDNIEAFEHAMKTNDAKKYF